MSEDGKKYLSDHLKNLIEKQEGVRWLNIEDLQVGDILKVQTKNSLYEMKMTDPEKHKVMITSDSESAPIKEESAGSILGSTLTGTGTMLKMGRIGIDYQICLWIEGKGELILSSTQQVFINDIEVLM